MIDYKTKGIKIPKLPKDIWYSTTVSFPNSAVPAGVAFPHAPENNPLVSFGEYKNGTIRIEAQNYTGNYYWLVKEEDLKQLTKENMQFRTIGTRFTLKSGVSYGYLNKGKKLNNIASVDHQVFSHGLEVIEGENFIKFSTSATDPDPYIMRESDLQSGEIIGYKCPTDLFKGDVVKGTLFITKGAPQFYFPDGLTRYSVPTEIAESWEPVFKDTPKEITLGNPSRNFTVSKESVVVEDGAGTKRAYTWEEVESLKNFVNQQPSFKHHTITIDSIHIGCSEGTSLTPADFNTLNEVRNGL